MEKKYRLGIVYRVYKKDDLGMAYVGSTFRTLKDRYASHRSSLNYKRTRHLPLYRAMREYGEDAFDIEELWSYGCEDKEELEEHEQVWINTLEPPLNTNRARGKKRQHTEEGREAHREYQKKRRMDPAVRARDNAQVKKRRLDPDVRARDNAQKKAYREKKRLLNLQCSDTL
jgi:hypothetical protein